MSEFEDSALASKFNQRGSKECSSGSSVTRSRKSFEVKKYLGSVGALHLLTIQNQRGGPLLHIAVGEQRADVVEVLIHNGEDPNIRGLKDTTPLQEAAAKGYTAVVKVSAIGYQLQYVLLENGADISAETTMGETPLLLASHAGNQDVVEMLRAAGAEWYYSYESLTDCAISL
ncbi:unnamed protein product [Nezara viridula]|uniref:Uncharacterized protein n=1 Tax=Nezara viridula TaxID=85310 RepID=A0A9P0H782_NEZVI|nr:unnamed protein product [Nezara viridula]